MLICLHKNIFVKKQEKNIEKYNIVSFVACADY